MWHDTCDAAAIFFHDAVYNVQQQDNEELSALLWEEFAAAAANLPSGVFTTMCIYIYVLYI